MDLSDWVLAWAPHHQELGDLQYGLQKEESVVTIREPLEQEDPDPWVGMRFYHQEVVVQQKDGSCVPVQGEWMTVVWANKEGLVDVRADSGPVHFEEGWHLRRVPEGLYGTFFRDFLPGDPDCPDDPGCPFSEPFHDPIEVERWRMMDKSEVYRIDGQWIASTSDDGLMIGECAVEHIASAGGIPDQIEPLCKPPKRK